ncbi:hypothetical protein C8Q76DRAFT_722586 [Earliella scabrosa]|nr:hypothetical protein C8Q76DRAFT_722586 [Earliella scabrosa]
MAHRCVRKFRLATPSKVPDIRQLHCSPACHNVLAAPFAEYSTASSSSSAERPLDVLRKQKADEVRNLLSLRGLSHNRVWASYVDLLQYCDTASVPLDIHKSVLRRCAPRAKDVRATHAQKLAAGRKFVDDRVYESRFQRIIRNIRSTGATPALEDYHCILELFAAVGNHQSAMMVLQEIGRAGLAREPRTYALCLQALCHRLTLPVWHLDRSALVDEVTKHCLAIVKEMAESRVPFAPVNVDLAFRILKETLNMEGFTTIMRMAYGVDLDYPDRPPLEYWDKTRDTPTEVEVQEGAAPLPFPSQLPFTQAAFHTTLDYLGRAGDISKLVQTFEVVTTPLPSSTFNPAFDDDDDDDFGISNPQVAPYRTPHIRPNTTSFSLMLRWTSKARHYVLARHYLLVAIALERDVGRQLREWTRTRPPADIPAPNLTINRTLFMPAFWLANRNKKMGLLRWLQSKVHRTVRQKRDDIEFYEACRERWVESGVHQPKLAVDGGLAREPIEDLPPPASSSQFSTFFSPSSSSQQPSAAQSQSPLPDPTSLLTAPPAEAKSFDIDLHLAILRRDLGELEILERRIEDVLSRNTQRVKERLGRRVWGGKDVYLRHVGRRTNVTRETWREVVNFRPQSEIEAGREAARVAKTKERQPQVGAASTAAHSLEEVPEVVRDLPPHKIEGS